jgi:hypothetical protein
MAESKKGRGKLFVFGGILIAVVAIVIIAVTSYPPSEDDVSGTIGAAKKYRAEQIKEADVLLDNPEMQELLQNDEILALLQDEEFRKMIASDEFAKLTENPVAIDFIASGAVDKISRYDRSAPIIFNPDFARASADRFAVEAANLTMLSRKFADDKSALDLVIGNDALLKSMADGRFPLIARNQAVLQAMCDPTVAKVMSNQPALRALFDPRITSMFMRGELDAALADPGIAKFVKGSILDRSRREPVLQDFLSRAEADGILSGQGVLTLLTSEDFLNAMGDESAAAILTNQDFVKLAAQPSYCQAIISQPLDLKADPSRFKIASNLQDLARASADMSLIQTLFRNNNDLAALFQTSSVSRLLKLTAFHKLAASPQGMASLSSISKTAALARAAAEDNSMAQLFLTNNDVLRLAEDPRTSRLIKNNIDVFYAMNSDPQIAAICSKPEALHALADNTRLFQQGAFSKAFETDARLAFLKGTDLAKEAAEKSDVLRIGTNDAFMSAISHPSVAVLYVGGCNACLKALYDIGRLSNLPGLSRMVQGGQLSRAFADNRFISVFQKSNNRNLVNKEAFSRLMADLTKDAAI